MERARKKAVAISAFLVVVMLGISAVFIAVSFRTPNLEVPVNTNPIDGGDNNNNSGHDDNTPAVIEFAMPLSAPITLKAANFDGIQLNKTQGWYEFDLGYTLGTATSETVVAVYDGTVKDVVQNDASAGNLVRIQHDNGLETVYSSLGDIDVTKGQVLKKGDRIGTTGNTAIYEKFNMPYVRFEAYENGKPINPDKYVTFPEVEK
jgi:murein DD-endopeptidase MepM/ murein hydrolase activator NlpD